MKLTVMGVITIEGTVKQLSDYTARLLDRMKELSDKREREDAVNALLHELQGGNNTPEK